MRSCSLTIRIKQGRLGRAGIALIRNPPEGPFAVYYPDHHDVIAKSLAACCRDAISDGSTGEIFRMLQHPPEIIQSAIAAYDEYFNEMAYAGLATREQILVTQRLEQAAAC